MYYSFPCPYCGKVFFTFSEDKNAASQILYDGIKKHLTEYGEDEKEHTFDEPPQMEINEIYTATSGTNDKPPGGYEL